MLQKLNERIQGLVAWFVVILIALTFTLFGVDYYMQSRVSLDAKATVNGSPISSRTFENYYRRIRSQQEYSQLNQKEDKKLQEQILQQLIATEATVQSARKHGFEVTPQQANSAILNIPQFQQDGHFSAEKYQQALSSASFTPETFKREVQQGILLNQQRFAFIATSFALPEEINRFVKLYLQSRDYQYTVIPKKLFADKVEVSEKEIEAYYLEHQNEFQTPEKVSLEYLLLSSKDIRKQITINETEVKSFYEENKNNFMTPAQWKVAHILLATPESASNDQLEAARLRAEEIYAELQKSPERFEHYVKSASDDKLSLPAKGELPWLTAGQSEFDAILSGLAKPGQIAAPAKTRQGYEIFKLADYKPAVIKPFEDVKQIIKDQFLSEQTQSRFAQQLELLTDMSYQTPDTLAEAAKAVNLPVQKTALVSTKGGSDIITKNKQIMQTAFSHDVLELGNNSEPIQIDADTVAVIRVSERVPAKIESLDAVKANIRTIIQQQYASQKAQVLGALLASPISEAKMKKLMAANQLKWITVEHASRDNDKGAAMINEIAFTLPKPESKQGMTLSDGDYAVVKLLQINDGYLGSLDAEQRDSLIQQIEASYGMMDYDLYVKSLVKKAAVERL